MNKISKLKNSLVVRATALMVALMLLLVIVLIIGNINLYKASTDAAIESINSSIAVFEKQMSEKLRNASTGLNELAASVLEEDLIDKPHALQNYFSSLQLGRLLNQKLSGENIAKSFFYVNENTSSAIFRYRSSITTEEKFLLQDYLSKNQVLQSGAFLQQWDIVRLGAHTHLLQVYRIGNGYLGCAVRLEDLLLDVDFALAIDTTQYIFADNAGIILLTHGSDFLQKDSQLRLTNMGVPTMNNYFFTSRVLADTKIVFSAIKHKNDIYMSIWPIQLSLIFLGVITIILAITNALYLYRKVLNPIRVMVLANKQIEEGNMSYQIKTKASSSEFDVLQGSFNKMVAEIRNLKIKSYEDRIERQKQELNFLKAQIRPHFFQNAITTISSLAYQNKNNDIQHFIVSLSAYLRYMITDPFGHATVESEILAACDYIAMQQIRYPNRVFFMTEIDEAVKLVPIPKLMVQTFAENIFKHAFDPEKMLSIFIRADLADNNVIISIEDNGVGFPLYMLQNQTDEPIVSGEHIGINNIRRMLFLQYGCTDHIMLHNVDPSGARIEITLPLTPLKEPQ